MTDAEKIKFVGMMTLYALIFIMLICFLIWGSIMTYKDDQCKFNEKNVCLEVCDPYRYQLIDDECYCAKDKNHYEKKITIKDLEKIVNSD